MKRVHLSIHDVSPAWEREVEIALELSHAAGAKPALLVVPNFHGKAPLDASPRFQARLRELEKSGHEVYLHGYYHRAAPRSPEEGGQPSSLWDKARRTYAQRIVSAGEAEFSDVTPEEASQRLDDGERMLKDAGLTIRGFVAPAWSMPAWVLSMLGRRGYTFTEDHGRIYNPKEGTRAASLVLNFASRTPMRLFSSVAYCRAMRPCAAWVPARIAIHPADMRFALLRGETRSLLSWAKGAFARTGSELLS